MEVTSVVGLSAILLFLCIANILAQNGILLDPGHSSQFQEQISLSNNNAPHVERLYEPLDRIERSAQQASAIAGLPPADLIVPNLPSSTYLQQSPYAQLALPSFSNPFGFSLIQPKLPLIKSIFFAVKDFALFTLNALGFSDTDRHKTLRNLADDINAFVDNLMFYFNGLYSAVVNINRRLAAVPLLGLFVRMTEKLLYVVMYLPLKMLDMLRSSVKRIVDTNQPQSYAVPGMPYAFL